MRADRDHLRCLRRAFRCRRVSETGFTLMELLIAVSVSTIALCAAWSCLWNVGSAARHVDGRAQAATGAASAARSLAADLELATTLLAPPSGRSPETSIALQHRHPDEAVETVLVVWDPARRVLWRKAPGTYLADHVELFKVLYYGSDGLALESSEFADPAWPLSVARVSFRVVVRAPEGAAEARRDIALYAR
jgi:prepilin-type N-terminal cleavage/methylation domain-containing protein